MRMILDTSFVMTESFEQCLLESLQPLVQHIIPEQKKLVLPYSVVENELKKIGIGGGQVNPGLQIVKRRIDIVRLELGNHLIQRCAGQLHLIERLHGQQTRRQPIVFCIARHAPSYREAKSSRKRNSARQAFAAPPPLSFSVRRQRAQACASFSTV